MAGRCTAAKGKPPLWNASRPRGAAAAAAEACIVVTLLLPGAAA